MIPQTYTDLDDEQAEKVLRLLDLLEDLDDVTNLYTNANFPDEEGADLIVGCGIKPPYHFRRN